MNPKNVSLMFEVDFSHLTLEDVQWLISKGKYAFQVNYTENWALLKVINLDHRADSGYMVPKNIMTLYYLAKANKCTYIQFSTDAPLIDGLPSFEWTWSELEV